MPIGSIIGGLIGQGGANAAASAQGTAGSTAYNNGQTIGYTARAGFSPYMAAGGGAENALSQLYGLGSLVGTGDQYGDMETAPGGGYGTPAAAAAQKAAQANFQTSPGYQFRLQQGVNALNRSGAASGMSLSGSQAQALTNYGQNAASAEYGNYVSGLSSLASGGLSATGTGNQLYANAANAGNQDQFAGNMAQANSYQNSANALANGISGGINSLVSGAAFASGGFGGAGGGAPYSLTPAGSTAIAQNAVNAAGGPVTFSGI